MCLWTRDLWILISLNNYRLSKNIYIGATIHEEYNPTYFLPSPCFSQSRFRNQLTSEYLLVFNSCKLVALCKPTLKSIIRDMTYLS
jgi:hypothetical protein